MALTVAVGTPQLCRIVTSSYPCLVAQSTKGAKAGLTDTNFTCLAGFSSEALRTTGIKCRGTLIQNDLSLNDLPLMWGRDNAVALPWKLAGSAIVSSYNLDAHGLLT